MYEYNFTRELINGRYNIENKDRVDGEGNQIYLFQEIKASFADNPFKIICNGENVKIFFQNELTTEQQSTLTTIINNHKNNL